MKKQKQKKGSERSEEEEEEEEEEEGSSMDDRLSELPQPILQQILSLLDQVSAVRTSVLSKSWRYLWTLRPNIDFHEETPRRRFRNKLGFLSALDKTLERYLARNLPIHRLSVEVWMVDSFSVSLLENWIPKLRIFYLSFVSGSCLIYKDPHLSSVFEAENLQKLYLKMCILNLNSIRNVLLCKHLHTLHLVEVNVSDETFEKIVSICPKIESLTLEKCTRFRITDHQLNNLHHLKHFDFTIAGEKSKEENVDELSIELDAPSLETIKINSYLASFHHHKLFPNLKSLTLEKARLTSKSFDFFSWDLPSLENLELKRCNGDFEEFRLVSRSIKRLSFLWGKHITQATIDVPAILYFEYSSISLPSIFTFTTNSSRWESYVHLDFDSVDDSSWFLKLNEVLRALSHSEISLHLQKSVSGIAEKIEEIVVKPGIYGEPVVVERLVLYLGGYSLASYRAFMNELFLICHPRNIAKRDSYEHLTLKSCKILVVEGEGRDDYSWSKDLEEISVEAFHESGEQWINRLQGTGLSITSCAAKLLAIIQDKFPEIRFRLKWREMS